MPDRGIVGSAWDLSISTGYHALVQRKPTQMQRVYDVVAELGTATLRDVCARLDISRPSAKAAMRELRKKQLITTTFVAPAYRVTTGAERPKDARGRKAKR